MPKRAVVKEKIGYMTITPNGELIRSDKTYVYFFKVEPSNLAVLSSINIRTKILSLASLEKQMGQIEMYALDDRENYGENRKFLRDRIAAEENIYIRRILEEDEKFIREVEADASSARTFLISFRVPQAQHQNFEVQLKNFERLANQSELKIHRIKKEELKEMIAVYFQSDTTSGSFPDVDGEDYYDDVDFDDLEYQIKNNISEEEGKGFSIIRRKR